MTIKILPARLANQIAAGEVVERPASVVKEIVENALDAGATQITVDVIKGGHKRILVRDNGKGIAKEQLQLALSRHATSKITDLDDLTQILSLGFRGEALASISSVSRLTLTSKPQAQSEAWQAQSEGRDMQVQITPAAHPDGTSVEVLDIFFNTPARRKFLRTEKTEFNHIDELIKRIALSRFDVHFSLLHNGKKVRNFPIAKTDTAKLQRMASVCGNRFKEHALQLESDYQDMRLSGWLAGPGMSCSSNELQYVYVNGRMMRDKLINHAIRQAFEGLLPPDDYPAYVLYLDIDPEQVDVNVHPAKHEVRFHQGRLVHDFIFTSVNDALNSAMGQGELADDADPHWAGDDRIGTEPRHNYVRPLQSEAADATFSEQQAAVADYSNSDLSTSDSETAFAANAASTPHYGGQSANTSGGRGSGGYQPDPKPAAGYLRQAGQNYQQLMQPSSAQVENVDVYGSYINDGHANSALSPSPVDQHSFSQSPTPQEPLQTAPLSGVAMLPVDGHFFLCQCHQAFWRIATEQLLAEQVLTTFQQQVPVAQPLLMPIAIEAEKSLIEKAKECKQVLTSISVDIETSSKRIILRKVPAALRDCRWSDLLALLLEHPQVVETPLQALVASIANVPQPLAPEAQQQLWHWWWQQHQDQLPHKVTELGQAVPLAEWLNQQGTH